MTSSLKFMLVALSVGVAATATVSHAKNAKHAAAASCPPGLAKKNPPCVPPGQAKKYVGTPEYRKYRIGDRIDDDYFWIESPGRYGLRKGSYVRAGDYVYRVNRETREVLNLIGAVIDVLD